MQSSLDVVEHVERTFTRARVGFEGSKAKGESGDFGAGDVALNQSFNLNTGSRRSGSTEGERTTPSTTEDFHAARRQVFIHSGRVELLQGDHGGGELRDASTGDQNGTTESAEEVRNTQRLLVTHA